MDSRQTLALPDTLSHNTHQNFFTRKTSVEIPQNIKLVFAKDETSRQLECKHATKNESDTKQKSNLEHFPLS